MKALLLSLILATTFGAAHAEEATDMSIRPLVGSCIAVQAARLDDGSRSLDVIAKAIAAGCMPTLRTALAAGTAAQNGASVAVMHGDFFDAQEADNTMQDMAASVVQWLRSANNARLLAQRK